MARKLLTTVALASASACVAACALWVRSRYACDVVYRTDAAGERTAVCSADGVLQLSRSAGTAVIPVGGGSTVAPIMVADPPHPWQWVRSPPDQAAFSLIRPAAGDAAFATPVGAVVARPPPVVYTSTTMSGFSGGGRIGWSQAPAGTATVSVSVSDAFLAGLFALPPLVWLCTTGRRRLVLRSRRRLGRCAGCGYDLTGNVSGVCPECATPAVPTAA